MNDVTHPALLNAPQAAQLLSISERRLHELRHTPSFPAAVLLSPRCIRWSRDELIAYTKTLPRIEVQAMPSHLKRLKA